MSGKPIHIVLAFDGHFWAPAYALMRSICLSTKRRGDLNFHLFHQTLNDVQRADLDKITPEFGAALHYYDLDTNEVFLERFGNASAHRRWPLIVYGRLMIDEILPPEIDRVIYLDCDMMVRAPIEQIYELDLEGHPIAAVADPWSVSIISGRDMAHETKADLFDPADRYFNSGMLVIDRKGWREAEPMKVYEKLVENGAADRLYYDQDLLNLIFMDNWLALEPIWNLLNPRSTSHVHNVAILHYTGEFRPWNLVSGVAFAGMYRHTMTNELFYRYMRYRWKKWWIDFFKKRLGMK
jgi:lipopolysaccharide biosynthesis glycosyltransferase